ncbi:hypothetical protein [Herbidospora cretacea]|uniref:hypothetical protein n=1 Tax=Herbidospora cretacea TaxID=28444 RepID=UPI0007732908|nr:hypothetical protein [Herbidospora cretacea]
MAPGRPSIRHAAELALPGVAIGAVGGAMAGGLTLITGQPAGWAAVAALTLALPLALFGGVFSTLCGLGGPFRPGLFAPAGLFWLVAFPLSRLIQQVSTGLILDGQVVLAGGVAGFLAYQALVSLGFAIGFVWLHERLMPHWLIRLAGHNPVARTLLQRYVEHAEALNHHRRSRKARGKGPTKGVR